MTMQVASICYLKTLTAMAFFPKINNKKTPKYMCLVQFMVSIKQFIRNNRFSVPKKEKIRHIKRLILYSVFKLRKGYGLCLTSLMSSFHNFKVEGKMKVDRNIFIKAE